MQKYVVIEKAIGETPLAAMEAWRAAQPPAYQDVPLAYAGRLDPMASGKLLILIDEECKQQEKYHGLDKTYEFEVLFGVSSDSGDVLGLIQTADHVDVSKAQIRDVANKFIGPVTFPYPQFSSKTVQGKPLHTWTLEGRLSEIEIPTYTTNIFKLSVLETKTLSGSEVYAYASQKIETIPPVTDERKAIGNDFRRPDIRMSWQAFLDAHAGQTFTIAKFSCICISGTYMRTLAEEIAKTLGTNGLAFSIHRTKIGKYQPLPFRFGFWSKKY